jgi:hypothetical protein
MEEEMTDADRSGASWGPEHVEHLARRAAELGDSRLEGMCDAVLAGHIDVDMIANIVADDTDYSEWMERGLHCGWKDRVGSSLPTPRRPT